ncbi:hypothetical protein ABPG77_007874 [Micractinium sp. CCAP 211/92]
MRQQQQLKAAAQKQQMQHVQQIGARAQCQQQRTQGWQWVEQRLEPRRDVAQRQKQRQAAENRVWPKPPRQPADLPLFPLGPEELATLDYLQARVRMSEAEAEQALARMCTLYETRQQRTRRLVFSFEKQVKPTIEYLAGLPGLNLKQCISAYPTILVKGMVSELDRRLLRLRNRLGLTAAECSKLLSKSPHTLLTGDLDGRIFPFLDGLEALGFSREEVKAMVLRVSTLLLFSVGKLHDRVAWLKGLGMSLDDVRAVVWKFPTVVCHTSSNCEACLQWMQQLGVPREECAIIIRRLPPVITYSAQKRARFLDFMRDEVGLDDAGIARILRHTPDTLGRAVERLRHNLVQLEAFGMNPDQIRRLVVTNPSVLRMDISSPTYRNKLKYLQEELQVEDPVDAVVSCPFYLSYRLDRIVLRAEYLKAIGASYTSIAAWLAMSERRFCEKWAGTSVAQFRAWAAEWQHSPQGRHWLQLASERNSLMHTRRVLLEAAADAASDKEARVEMEEAAAEAAEHARRHREAQRLFQRQAARAAEERKGQHSREQLRLEQLEEELQRQAAQVEQSAQHWEQQAERLLRLARTAAGEQEPLTEQAAI